MRFNVTCTRCGGTGRVRTLCRVCGGEGRVRRAETIDVRIPAGVQPARACAFPAAAMPEPHGAPPGDLYIITDVQPHPYFERRGDDLYTVVPITITEAALGAKIEVPTLDGRALLRVPPGTNSGQKPAPARKGRAVARSARPARRSVRRIASGGAQAGGRARPQSAEGIEQARAGRSAPRSFRARGDREALPWLNAQHDSQEEGPRRLHDSAPSRNFTSCIRRRCACTNASVCLSPRARRAIRVFTPIPISSGWK